MAIPLLQKPQVGAYVVRQHLRRAQALSARADAGAAVPLQSRLRRLRQDRLPGQDPQPAAVASTIAWRRSTNAARRWCRSPAASRCCTSEIAQIVEGIIAREQVRLPLHQCAADGEEARRSSSRSPYFVWSVHLDGDREMHDRSVCEEGVYDRAVAAIAQGQGAGLPRQHQLHAVRRRRAGARRELLRQREGDWASTASRCRPAMPTSARPTRSISSTARRPSSCSATSSAAAAAARLVVQPVRACSSISSPATRNTTARPGAIRRATCSAGSGPAICWAKAMRSTFKELMEETDWDSYGTGNYEKCADCMVHCGFEATAVQDAVQHPLKALRRRAARRRDRGRDGAGDPARPPAPGAIRLLTPRRAASWPKSGRPSPGQGSDGRVTSARQAPPRCRRRCAISAGNLARRAAAATRNTAGRSSVPSARMPLQRPRAAVPARPDRRSRGTPRTAMPCAAANAGRRCAIPCRRRPRRSRRKCALVGRPASPARRRRGPARAPRPGARRAAAATSPRRSRSRALRADHRARRRAMCRRGSRGSRPPAMPKLMMPLQPALDGRRRARSRHARRPRAAGDTLRRRPTPSARCRPRSRRPTATATTATSRPSTCRTRRCGCCAVVRVAVARQRPQRKDISSSRDSAGRTRAGNPSAVIVALGPEARRRPGWRSRYSMPRATAGMVDLAGRHQAEQRPGGLRGRAGRRLVAAVVELVAVAVLAPAAVGFWIDDQPVDARGASPAHAGSTPAALSAHSADHVP